nr:secretion protein [uncultured Flavobacterium sp.]
MKTISKLSLAVVFALASLNTYAIDGDFLLNVKKGKGNEISFALNGQQKVIVSIYDTENNLLFTEYASGKKGISKTYSLEEFPDGKYILVIENNLKTVKHEIVVSKKETVLNRKSIAEVYKNSAKKYLAIANN